MVSEACPGKNKHEFKSTDVRSQWKNPILNVKIMSYSFGVGSWTVIATIVD